MTKEKLIEMMMAEMESVGYDWGVGLEVSAIMDLTGLEYEQVLEKLEKAGYSEDFVDIDDLYEEFGILGEDIYNKTLELCAESLYADGLLVKGVDALTLPDDWEDMESYDDILNSIEYEEYKDKITKRGFDFIKDSWVDTVESAIERLGKMESGEKSEFEFKSDLRLSEKNIKGRFDSIEEAYSELRDVCDWYALKLRGEKVTDSEFEDLKGIMANREIDCGILDLCGCYMTRGEICAFFVDVFGFKNVSNYSSFIELEDRADYCKVLIDYNDLFDYELVG